MMTENTTTTKSKSTIPTTSILQIEKTKKQVGKKFNPAPTKLLASIVDDKKSWKVTYNPTPTKLTASITKA
jgi:hypothetical protein